MTQVAIPQVWLTLGEAAQYTRLSESRLRQLIANGTLKVSRSNGRSGKIIIRQRDLDIMLHNQMADAYAKERS